MTLVRSVLVESCFIIDCRLEIKQVLITRIGQSTSLPHSSNKKEPDFQAPFFRYTTYFYTKLFIRIIFELDDDDAIFAFFSKSFNSSFVF